MNDWQVDKDGRRFRKISEGCIEYETDYVFKGVNVEETKTVKPEKNCPFISGMSLVRKCRKECAFYSDNGCMKNTGDTAGKKCPFNPYTCDKDCALYDSGCKVARVMKEVK